MFKYKWNLNHFPPVQPGEYIPPTLQETANEISYYMQNYQLCEQTKTGGTGLYSYFISVQI